VDVGFELNFKEQYVLRLFRKAIIGAYNCTHNVKTMFIYKCQSEGFEGYSLKKVHWLSLV